MTQQELPRQDPVRAAVPYVLPYVVFAAFTFLGGYLPSHQSLIYIMKVLAVGGVLWMFRRQYTELRPCLCAFSGVAALVGLAVIVVWVGLDPWYPQTPEDWKALREGGIQVFDHPGKAEGGFNPFRQGSLIPPVIAIAFRLMGAVLLVPVFEELFVRSWLARVLIHEDFRSVPVGAFSWTSFVITVAFFGLTHREWLAGLICGVAFNLLLYWRKDLFHCVLAHAVANAALAAWVLIRQDWGFW